MLMSQIFYGNTVFYVKMDLLKKVSKALSFWKNVFFGKSGLPTKPDYGGKWINSEIYFSGFFP